jgi:hypothetical protein
MHNSVLGCDHSFIDQTINEKKKGICPQRLNLDQCEDEEQMEAQAQILESQLS